MQLGQTKAKVQTFTIINKQMKSVQERFQIQVRALVHSFETLGNPFMKTAMICLSWTLKKLLARKWLPQSTGLRMPARSSFRCFWRKHKKEVTDIIKLNKFALFSNPRNSPSKGKLEVTSRKQNWSLFSQLYISCQVRQGSLDEFTKTRHILPPFQNLVICDKL